MQQHLFFEGYVGSAQLRHFANNDPLLDWLDAYGEERGFVRDDRSETYREDCDFAGFLFRKGQDFRGNVERHLMACLDGSYGKVTQRGDGLSFGDQEATIERMRSGCKAIGGAILFDPTSRTFGRPDLLIRADVLDTLLDVRALDGNEVDSMVYVAVDVKYSSFVLQKRSGEPGGEDRGKLIRLAISERALAHALGRKVGRAFILGRSVVEHEGDKDCPRGCFDRLAPVTAAKWLGQADQAADWVRDLRCNGAHWDPLAPHRHELVPNLGNGKDYPWHRAKHDIAGHTRPLNALWHVGWPEDTLKDGRFRRWDDPGLRAEHVLTGPTVLPKLAEVLRANTSPGFTVGPARIQADEGSWREFNGVEFFVDFETVSDLDDDFWSFPIKGGSPCIFMVGCGHVEDGKWMFECFVADDLTSDSERKVLNDWFDHLEAVVARVRPGVPTRHYHWSHAENTFLEKAYNSARERLGGDWPEQPWYDLLTKVARVEPVVVRGAMAFGLKAIAKAMHAHGLIETNWEDGPMDGLAASVAAWNCAKRTKPMHADPLMDEVRKYNEVDCRVMWEILEYLRRNH